jgi:hypothetical protein
MEMGGWKIDGRRRDERKEDRSEERREQRKRKEGSINRR